MDCTVRVQDFTLSAFSNLPTLLCRGGSLHRIALNGKAAKGARRHAHEFDRHRSPNNDILLPSFFAIVCAVYTAIHHHHREKGGGG